MSQTDFMPHYARQKTENLHLDILLEMSLRVRTIIAHQRDLNTELESFQTALIETIAATAQEKGLQKQLRTNHGAPAPKIDTPSSASNEKPVPTVDPKPHTTTEKVAEDDKPVKNTRSLRGTSLHNTNLSGSKSALSRRYYQDRPHPKEEYIRR